jgi:hypothetical protein
MIAHILKRADELIPDDKILTEDRQKIALTVVENDSETERGVTFIKGTAPSLSITEWTWFAGDLLPVLDREHGTTRQRFEILLDWETQPERGDEASTPEGVEAWVRTMLDIGRFRGITVKEVIR